MRNTVRCVGLLLVVAAVVGLGLAAWKERAYREECYRVARANADAKQRSFDAAVREEQLADVCLENLQVLGIAALCYALEHNRFPRAANWRQALQPYIMMPDPLEWWKQNPYYTEYRDSQTCPSGAIYAMNRDFSNVRPGSGRDPEDKRLLCETDEQGRLVYVHQGKTHVVLRTGHAVAMTKEESASLKW